MGRLIVFFLFLGKHALCANVIDVGYSESRNQHTLAVSWLYLSYQILLEAIATVAILGVLYCFLGGFVVWRWETFAIMEGLGQVLAWNIERRATFNTLISSHLIAEISFLVLYCLLVAALYPF